jgi:hypothetical protein
MFQPTDSCTLACLQDEGLPLLVALAPDHKASSPKVKVLKLNSRDLGAPKSGCQQADDQSITNARDGHILKALLKNSLELLPLNMSAGRHR